MTRRAAGGYEWDLFLSYSRSGASGPWVRELFYPTLRLWLDTYKSGVKVFYDEHATADSGNWPQSVRRGVLRSKLMISVLSPSYFSSPWCKAEWSSMRMRERKVGLGAGAAGDVLIYSIAFANPNGLPAEAKKRDLADFSDWNIHGPFFRDTVDFKNFSKAVQVLVEKVVQRTQDKKLPKFDPGWQVTVPRVKRDFQIARPKLA
jgi:hypothetical protein